MSDERKELKEKELMELLAIAVQNSIEYFVINKDSEFKAKIPKLQQMCKQITNLIQQKPEVDEKYVRDKATYMFEHEWKRWNLDDGDATKEEIIEEYGEFLTQIISDVRGGKK